MADTEQSWGILDPCEEAVKALTEPRATGETVRMIISASYKTDIPTFYGEWFRNRLRAGYCMMINSYNRKAYRVELSQGAVDAFVFWTKNAGPFLSTLDEVRDRGFPFVVQYTINGYPRELETSVIDHQRSIETAHRVSSEHGADSLVWRYDPIVFSSLTPHEFHLQNFERLARALRGASNEVVVSIAQIYRKTRRNLERSAEEHGFSWEDPSDERKHALLSELVSIAKANQFQLTICSQLSMAVAGSREARCVDARRIEMVSGGKLSTKLKGNRAECGCYESRDIGEYDTCPHGCVYCYSVQERPLALQRFRDHDPSSEYLFAPPAGPERKQLPLFGG
jgi:hypothetical protein